MFSREEILNVQFDDRGVLIEEEISVEAGKNRLCIEISPEGVHLDLKILERMEKGFYLIARCQHSTLYFFVPTEPKVIEEKGRIFRVFAFFLSKIWEETGEGEIAETDVLVPFLAEEIDIGELIINKEIYEIFIDEGIKEIREFVIGDYIEGMYFRMEE